MFAAFPHLIFTTNTNIEPRLHRLAFHLRCHFIMIKAALLPMTIFSSAARWTVLRFLLAASNDRHHKETADSTTEKRAGDCVADSAAVCRLPSLMTSFCSRAYSGSVLRIAVATVQSSGDPSRFRQAAKRDWMRHRTQKRTVMKMALLHFVPSFCCTNRLAADFWKLSLTI